MEKKKVRFERFVFGEGFSYDSGDEGVVIAETESAYKVRTSWFNSEWVKKENCEVITKF